MHEKLEAFVATNAPSRCHARDPTSVPPMECRGCDEGFEREEGHENEARADVRRTPGNHEHS